MIFPEWQGRQIVTFSRRVYQELEELGIDLWVVKYILEYGFDCQRSKRRKGIVERCIRSDRKVVKVVVEEFETFEGNRVWLLLHVGMIGMKNEWEGL